MRKFEELISMPMPSHTWGTTTKERQLSFPCDRFISNPDDSLFRGLTINAAQEILFRWLCQLRVAPYSYDWIDNGGRQSPPVLTPGLEQLEIGQTIMQIFRLTSFETGRHITLRSQGGSSAAGRAVRGWMTEP